jgi:hypothetical protein
MLKACRDLFETECPKPFFALRPLLALKFNDGYSHPCPRQQSDGMTGIQN